ACNVDLETYGLTTDITAWFRRMMGAPTEAWKDTLARFSPLKHVDRCQTPTLDLHREKDDRYPLYHGRAWYVGLKQRGLKTGMIIYPREGHARSELPLQLDLMQRVLAWFDRHLKDR